MTPSNEETGTTKKKCEIAECEEITRSSHGFCRKHRHKLDSRKNYMNKYCKEYHKSGRALQRRRASSAVNNAIAMGSIKKRGCEICDSKSTEAHHDDYRNSAWLKVRWLCVDHHRQWHNHHSPIYSNGL